MDTHSIKTVADLKAIASGPRSLQDLHLGEILLDEKLATRDQLDTALREQQEHPGVRLGNILVEMGTSTRNEINAALARKFGIPAVTFEDFTISPGVIATVPVGIALQYNVLPLAEVGGRLIVAMENPLNWEALDVLRFHTNHTIEPVIAAADEILRAFGKYYGDYEEAVILEDPELKPATAPGEDVEKRRQHMEEEAGRKPVVRLLNAIILQGVLRGASDIHLRPGNDNIAIYYRIDGYLQFSRTLSKTLLLPLVNRLKITGQMDIAERRLPQGGHARLQRGDSVVDLRMSVIPTVDGESVVIRILNRKSGFKPLDDLGMDAGDLERLRKILTHRHGMILVTGPTGSGKSTTLYALLDKLKETNPHIITVEDPVEFTLEDVEQIQVFPATGYTFAEALRQILRHDPDVIMVGEIRDLETAKIATKAALTGHLVLSTLHTNDAVSAVTRLTEMGIESYILGSTLLGVMAQRLMRRNCPDCSEVEEVSPEIRKELEIGKEEVFHRGRGCPACGFTGYRGRTLVCELLPITQELVHLINRRATGQEIDEQARAGGMQHLTRNALELARSGITSLEEVFAIRLE